MDKRNIESIYQLSPMQQGMLFHTIEAPESGLYVEQLTCTLTGNLNVTAFQQAWQKVVDRHSILRTAFAWKKLEKMLQVVYHQVELPVQQLDWRHRSEADQAGQLEQLLTDDRHRGLKLTEPPLLRLTLVRLAENTWQLVWTHHHLLLDGWSMPLVIKEVFLHYEAFNQGKQLNLPPARPYRDYIAWLQKQDLARAEAFWRQTLTGFYSPTPLTVDRTIGMTDDHRRFEEQEIKIPGDLTTTLQTLVRQHHITLNTLVQGAWAALLHRYSGEDDIVFGATVSGRPADLEGVDTMVGLFINTLPIRAQVNPYATLLDWLKALQAQQAELRQFEYSSLVDIQGWSQVPRTQPLFDSILVFENYPVDRTMQQHEGSLKISNFRSKEQTNYPLTIVAAPEEEFLLKISYNASRFNDGTIGRMLLHLQKLLTEFATNPEQKIASLTLLTDSEWQENIVKLNDNQIEYPENFGVHQWFEANVEKNPEAIAVVYENKQLTYQALNQRANQLAHFLQKHGVGLEVPVGIYLDRSLEMIIGLLGVIKAGGAYVPMDPSYPPERIAYILNDSKVPVLLTQQQLVDKLPAHNARVVCLDSDWHKISREDEKNPINKTCLENLIYMIYTSGSTGLPKGVMLRHRGLYNTVYNAIQDWHILPSDHVLQFASFSFDASAMEIFLGLLSGATLYLAQRETLMSGDDLVTFMRKNTITTVTLPPSLLILLTPEELPALKTVVSVGEGCTWEVAKRWCRDRHFYNGYGPTEATIGCSWYLVDGDIMGTTTVPVGGPFHNARVYITDRQLNPVPVGVPGELLIGGAGLARGYLGRAGLTAEKFIPDIFGDKPGERLYKTGDLARYLPHGNIEFLGRIDFQVKLRGYRIELGEIEAVLVKHPAIQNCVVIDREDQPGQKRLVAYLVSHKEARVSIVDLQDYLKNKLPEYMVPSAFMTLNELPVTPNGKVDRKALPAPEPGVTEGGFVVARTPTEELLVTIWQNLLHVPQVGIYDNFLELGGHSLLATQLVSRIRKVFNIEFPLHAVLETPTVAELARKIDAAGRESAGIAIPPIVALAREPGQDLPLSFAQQRLWFLDQLAPGQALYNIPAAIRLKGELTVSALEQSINEIIRRHEALRTTFKAIGGRPVQMIMPELRLPLEKIDLQNLPADEREAEARRRALAEARQPFDLAKGPLLRATLLVLAETDYIIFFNMHHIISDGWSVGVLIREVVALYNSITLKQPVPLPNLSIQYADFSYWQQQWLQGEILEKQLSYWRDQLSGIPPILELPLDRPRPAIQRFHGGHYPFSVPKELSDALQLFSREQGATLFMTLLAAFQVLLYRYSGQEDICVGTPIANRNYEETEPLIGFFVNTLVLRANFSNNQRFHELLHQIHDRTMGAYAYQDLPFEKLVEALQPGRDLSHSPLFQVMFVLQNAPMQQLELPNITFTPFEAESGTSKFDLTLIMAETKEGLSGTFEYNTDLFDITTIVRIAGHFHSLLEGIVTDPDQYVTALPILTEPEYDCLIEELNQTAVDYPADKTFHHLFETQVQRTPDALAAVYEDQQLTYLELNNKANQLANYLQKLGIGTEDLVGLCVERSLEMVVGILGVIKAGGAYLPLDPTYPTERLAYMIKDSEVPILLTQERLVPQLPDHNARVLRLDKDWETIANEPACNPVSSATSETMAYVIYTSGSTGKPKGVMLRHKGLCHLSEAQQYAFGVGIGNNVLQFAPFSFDASVWETIMALRAGATLHLTRPEKLVPGPDMIQLLQERKINTITLPPSILAALPEDALPELTTIVCAGEALPGELVRKWFNGRRFFNAYGPTEVTVCASYKLCNDTDHQVPPIGRPITNAKVYVLDGYLNPVPVGVAGELLVGGPGLAIGYLNRPGLTAEKFIPDPFSREPGSRLYKTGDLVRYRTNGDIEFLGRIDHQVKVRGFRIELGEIEAVLGQHPALKDVYVLAREDEPGDNRLVAYVVTDPDSRPTIGELRAYLNNQLPDYMVPSAFVMLDEFPLTPSGKVDRKALPAPIQDRANLGQEYLAPRNDTEAKLAEIVAQLLNIEKVGVYDNFFELGGHSLLATQFVSRIRELFQLELPLRSLFEKPTIAELANLIIESPLQSVDLDEPQIERLERGDDSLNQLLEDIDKLSDDEVKTLLS